MAVFYKWIKGCEPSATLDSKQWSYLTWGKGASDATNASSTTTEMMPNIKISSKVQYDVASQIDLGYILTSKMPTPLIQSDWRINKSVWFVDQTITTEDMTDSYFTYSSALPLL